MKYYRYELKKGSTYIGFLVAFDSSFHIFKDEDYIDLYWIFEKDLPNAYENIEVEGLSFFTEKGNKHFRKAIRKIKSVLKDRNFEYEINTAYYFR